MGMGARAHEACATNLSSSGCWICSLNIHPPVWRGHRRLICSCRVFLCLDRVWNCLKGLERMFLLNLPRVLFVATFLALWCAAWIGMLLRSRRQEFSESTRSDFNTVVGATLTLLGLLIGLPFPWRPRGTICARASRKKRQMPSARSMLGWICCLAALRRVCKISCGNIPICVSDSMKRTTDRICRRLTQRQRRCRISFGLRSQRRRKHSRPHCQRWPPQA